MQVAAANSTPEVSLRCFRMLVQSGRASYNGDLKQNIRKCSRSLIIREINQKKISYRVGEIVWR